MLYAPKPQEGQGLVEYALLLIFVSVVMVAILTILGPGLMNVYSNLVRTLNGVHSAQP
jgi:Flp pilus assembly pilin Flp